MKMKYDYNQGRLHEDAELQYKRSDFQTDGDWQRYFLKHGRIWEAKGMEQQTGESDKAYKLRCRIAWKNAVGHEWR